MANPTYVNGSYPLDYFALTSLNQSVGDDSTLFWSSDEALAPSTETLDFDFATERPVNYVDFQIIGKPVSVVVYYWDGAQWLETSLRSDVSSSLDFAYLPNSVWTPGRSYFETVNTRFIRLEFSRLTTAFPFADSDPFPWSIEIKNLRLIHIIASADDFQEDASLDIFGNPFRTALVEYTPEAVQDGDSLTYWQSQPNPSRYAVESLYFDLRTATTDDKPVVFDEIYLEPITPGVTMHVYVSDDSAQANWDFKLWTPVPRHYLVTQGNHALPAPISCKYVKLEFTRLSAVPYNTLDYPTPPPILYRLHPSWVQNEIAQIFPVESANTTFDSPYDLVTVDPLELGFMTPSDGFDVLIKDTRYQPEVDREATDDSAQLQTFVSGSAEQTAAQSDKVLMESQISFKPVTIWQSDLSADLDQNRALDRVLLGTVDPNDSNTTPFMAEDPLVDQATPSTQSVNDLSQAAVEKKQPITWFPRICRHEYQIISSPRPQKVAYFVAIKTVAFMRRDYDLAAPYDFDHYLELLEDDENLDYNDFTPDPEAPWRYTP